jgi:hypothetical protein
MQIMKKNKIITALLSLLLLQGWTTSCSDWLEVDTSTNVKQEVLFSDPDGYRTALNGLYRLLSGVELYGRNLTWGVASVLGNNYDATRLPGPLSTSYPTSYREMAAGDYTSKSSTDLIDPIWERGYRTIANCNNIITYIEKEDPAIFPVSANDREKNMILGEALGVRALVHFDLLRLFAPSAKADDGRTYIPYVTIFPERQPVHLTVTDALDQIIADLERAKTLLSEVDTVYNINRMRSYTSRLQPSTSNNATTFFSTRGTHFNYFAASAILARAYQWKGDAEKAYNAALDVYRYSTTQTWFTFTPAANLSTTENNIFRKMPQDIIFALYNNNMYALVAAATVNTSQSFYLKNDNYLFEGTYADDYRANLINLDKTSRRWTIPTANQTLSPTADIIKYQGPLAPVVRLSEMIYIMCEYLAGVDLPQAVTLLAKVKTARGSKTPVRGATKEEFLQDLYLDMTREFMSEGQTFFLYKRLNAPMYNGAGNINMTGRYVLPIPYSESAYISL